MLYILWVNSYILNSFFVPEADDRADPDLLDSFEISASSLTSAISQLLPQSELNDVARYLGFSRTTFGFQIK